MARAILAPAVGGPPRGFRLATALIAFGLGLALSGHALGGMATANGTAKVNVSFTLVPRLVLELSGSSQAAVVRAAVTTSTPWEMSFAPDGPAKAGPAAAGPRVVEYRPGEGGRRGERLTCTVTPR